MSVMLRAQHRRQLQDGLNTVFGLEYKRHRVQWKEIFRTYKSRKAYEEDLLNPGFGAAVEKAEGTAVTFASSGESWKATYHHVTTALAFALTQEAVEDGLYGDLGARYARALAHSLNHTTETRAAAILNNAFSSSAPGGDGVSLASTAHPMYNGGTFSNRLATAADLAEASLEDMLIGIDNFEDDQGLPIAVKARKLVLPTQLQFVATRVLKSVMQSGTANNDINAIREMGMLPEGYCTNHYLTDPDQFTILTDAPDGFKHFERRKLTRGLDGDFHTGNLMYKADKRDSFGFSDPRAAYLSPGA